MVTEGRAIGRLALEAMNAAPFIVKEFEKGTVYSSSGAQGRLCPIEWGAMAKTIAKLEKSRECIVWHVLCSTYHDIDGEDTNFTEYLLVNKEDIPNNGAVEESPMLDMIRNQHMCYAYIVNAALGMANYDYVTIGDCLSGGLRDTALTAKIRGGKR